MLWLRGSCVSLEGREGEDSVDFAKTQTISIKHFQDVVVKEGTISLLNTFRRDRVFPLSLDCLMQPSFSNYCGMKPWGDVLNRVLYRGGGGKGYP